MPFDPVPELEGQLPAVLAPGPAFGEVGYDRVERVLLLVLVEQHKVVEHRHLGLRLPRFSGRFVSLQSTSWSWRPACRLRRLSVSGIPGPNGTAADSTKPRCS